MILSHTRILSVSLWTCDENFFWGAQAPSAPSLLFAAACREKFVCLRQLTI